MHQVSVLIDRCLLGHAEGLILNQLVAVARWKRNFVLCFPSLDSVYRGVSTTIELGVMRFFNILIYLTDSLDSLFL